MAVAPCVKTDGRVRTARGARRPLRWSLACLIAAALGAVAAGCGATAPLAIDMNAQWATRIVDDHQVSLSVPANWNIGEAWVQPSSFDNLAGSFSNQSLSSPCSSGPSTLACGPPIDVAATRGGAGRGLSERVPRLDARQTRPARRRRSPASPRSWQWRPAPMTTAQASAAIGPGRCSSRTQGLWATTSTSRSARAEFRTPWVPESTSQCDITPLS